MTSLANILTKQPVEWAKTMLDANETYPANLNLVMSTDDTVLFAIEGARDETDNWTGSGRS